MLKVNYVEDTRPIKSATVTQPKGTLDLTLFKNSDGNRIRVRNTAGETINIAVSEIASFKEGLDKVAKYGAKNSKAA